MRTDVGQQLSASAADFARLIWPAIRAQLGGGSIRPTEIGSSEEMARDLDIRAGIDAWHYMDDGQMRGLASRVQWTPYPYETFTVRRSCPSGAPTEYHKRLAAVNGTRGELYPHLTVQGYVWPKTGGLLLAAAVASTADIIGAIDPDGRDYRRAPGGNTFWVVPWAALAQHARVTVVYGPQYTPLTVLDIA